MPYFITPPPTNPLSRLLAALVAVLVLVGAFFFGVFVLAFAAGLGLVAWIYISIRLWWIRRRGGMNPADAEVAREGRGEPRNEQDEHRGNVIDAEYTVVSKQDEES